MRRRNLMSQYTKSSFLVAGIALVTCAAVTAVAFSAPQPAAKKIQAAAKAKAKPKSKTANAKTAKHGKAAPHGKPAAVHIARKPSLVASVISIKAVVIDEPNAEDGTIPVIVFDNDDDKNQYFATIATSPGTRIARGFQVAAISNLHPGYIVRCEGKWDRDGYQYEANRVALGSTADDVSLVNHVNIACANIKNARKSGGFGQSLVAMIPTDGLPRAMSIGGKPIPTPAADTVPSEYASPVPGAPEGTGVPATAPTAPSAPATTAPATPLNPGLLPTTTNAAPGTNPAPVVATPVPTKP